MIDDDHQAVPPRRRVRWYFPALFVISAAAAAVAVAAWVNAARSSSLPTQADLSSLGAGAPETATAAPDFTVATLDGGSFTLSEHLRNDRRPVFLNLWATWCPPCREEMPLIDQAAATHPEIAFVGVAVRDGRGAVESFVDEIGVHYLIGIDQDDRVWDSYPVLGMPATFLIGADGTVIDTHIGILFPETIDSLLAEADGA